MNRARQSGNCGRMRNEQFEIGAIEALTARFRDFQQDTNLKKNMRQF